MESKVLMYLLLLFYCVNCIAANIQIDSSRNNDGAAKLNGELLPQQNSVDHQHHRRHYRAAHEPDGKCGGDALKKHDTFKLAQVASLSDACFRAASEIFANRAPYEVVQFDNAHTESFQVYEYFGPLIKRLSLKFDLQKGEYKQEQIADFKKLLDLINEKSRDSLNEFAIHYSSDCYLDIFEHIKGPFEWAEKVTIELKNLVFKTTGIRLNTIFPRVRELILKLDLDYRKYTDRYFVDGEYLNLNELSLSELFMHKSMEEVFENLLKKNPSIRTLSLENPDHRILQTVTERLPNLEELYVDNYLEDAWSVNLTFSSLKGFGIRLQQQRCSLPQRIQINPELENLQLYCSYSEIGDDYFAFLQRFPHLKELAAGAEFNHEHLKKLTGMFPELTSANFVVHNDVTVDDIAEFMNCSSQLDFFKLMYLSNPNAEEFKNQLSSLIGDDFDIQYERPINDAVDFVIERKVPRGNGARELASKTFIFAMVLLINSLLFN